MYLSKSKWSFLSLFLVAVLGSLVSLHAMERSKDDESGSSDEEITEEQLKLNKATHRCCL